MRRLAHVGMYAEVVNARHVRNVPGRKTDIGDSEWLTTLSRAGLLRGSFIPPEKMRQLRLIARQRQKLSGVLAAEKNRMHKVLTDGGIRLGVVVSDIHGQSARAMVKALIAGKATIDVLQLLCTIPGIDITGAAMLLVEIETDMSAFGSASRLASWVGICPGNNESAGKRKTGRTQKGNRYVRRLLCECAHAASRTTSVFRAKYTSPAIRPGHKRERQALAHKLLRTCYFMISRDDCYRDSTVDFEAMAVKRNAPSWIRALKTYGYIPAQA